jgi:uncharacterized protein YggE
MRRNRMAVLIALTALAIGAGIAIVITEGTGSNGAAAQSTATTDTVSVSGRGSVAAVPDTLVASLHVHTIGSSVQTALDTSASDARKVINALKGHGVAATDIKTTDLSLNPHYDRHGTVDGYQAGESLNVRIHPLTNVEAVLTAAATAAGNSVNIGSLSLTFADNSKLLTAARANAFANAKAAATQYAQLGGTTLAHVEHITSVVHNASPIRTYATSGAVSDSTQGVAGTPAIPIRAGQQKVSVTVNVIWTLA